MSHEFKNSFPSKKSVSNLKKGALLPKTCSTKIGDDTFNFSYREVDELIPHYLIQTFKKVPENKNDLTSNELVANELFPVSVDVVFGGDHGQGAFKVPMKLVMKYLELRVNSRFCLAIFPVKRTPTSCWRPL